MSQPMPIAPDGGYGWVTVGAAVTHNLVVDGICTAFSEFKGSFKETFQSSDAVTSLIGALLIADYLFIGPVAGGLMNKYGARVVVFAGGIIAAVAFALSAMVSNVYAFMLLYGGLGGIGFGFIYLPAIVVVGLYFEKKRAIATGIAVAGSGVGTFLMPLVAKFLIDNVGWRGAIFVFAALCIGCSFVGLLYKPLLAVEADVETPEVQMKLIGEATAQTSEPAKSGHQRNASESETDDKPVKRERRNTFSNASVGSGVITSLANAGKSLSRSTLKGLEKDELSRPLSRQDVMYTGSIQNLKEFKEEGTLEHYREVVTAPADEKSGGSEIFDVELLKNPTMLLLCISNLFGMMAFYIPFMFLKDLAATQGVNANDSVYFIPVIGITNTVGRIFFGWFADRGIVSALGLTNFSLILSGVFTCLVPLLPGYFGLMLYSVAFGSIVSAYICLTSIVLADLLGVARLTRSFGLITVFRGVACLVGAPLAGLAYDMFGSYSLTFYMGGAVFIVAGLFSLAISFLPKGEETAEKK